MCCLRQIFSFFIPKEDASKATHPHLFYIENTGAKEKRHFYLLGTYHTLPLSVFSEAVLNILKNQSNFWIEHLPMHEAIITEFDFFKIDTAKDPYLMKWWDHLEDDIRKKLMALFDKINPKMYPEIHPKFYFFRIMLNILLDRNNAVKGMDNELYSHYRGEKKSIYSLETYKEVLESISSLNNYGLKKINKFFNTRPECLLNFKIHDANHWIKLFNFFLKDHNYQLFYNAFQVHHSNSNKQDDLAYLNNKPVLNKPLRQSSDANLNTFYATSHVRSKNWYAQHFTSLNDCLIGCGDNHVFDLLDSLSSDGYDIYLVDNKGQKHRCNVTNDLKADDNWMQSLKK